MRSLSFVCFRFTSRRSLSLCLVHFTVPLWKYFDWVDCCASVGHLTRNISSLLLETDCQRIGASKRLLNEIVYQSIVSRMSKNLLCFDKESIVDQTVNKSIERRFPSDSQICPKLIDCPNNRRKFCWKMAISQLTVTVSQSFFHKGVQCECSTNCFVI